MTEYGCVGVTQPSSYGTNDKIGSLAHATGIAYRLNGPPHEQTAVVRTSDRTPVAALRSIGKSSHADSAPQTLLVAHLVQGRWGQRKLEGWKACLGPVAHVARALGFNPRVVTYSLSVQFSRVIVVARRG